MIIVSREILFRSKAINRDKYISRSHYKNGDWVYGNEEEAEAWVTEHFNYDYYACITKL